MRKGQNCFLVRNKNFYDPKIKIFKINAKIKKKKIIEIKTGSTTAVDLQHLKVKG